MQLTSTDFEFYFCIVLTLTSGLHRAKQIQNSQLFSVLETHYWHKNENFK